MPQKLGNGGEGPEEFNPKNGRYVEQPSTEDNENIEIPKKIKKRKTYKECEEEAEKYAKKGSAKYYSKLFDLWVAEPFFDRGRHYKFLKDFFRKKGMKISDFEPRKTIDEDKKGVDFFARSNGKRVNIDLKSKVVSNEGFEKPTIELSICSIKTNENGELDLDENGNVKLRDEYFFKNNMTHYFVFDLLNSSKEIKNTKDIEKNKMYIFKKKDAVKYFKNNVGTQEEVKKQCLEMFSKYKNIDKIFTVKENENARKYLGKNGELPLSNGLYLVKKIKKDKETYEIEKRYPNGVILRGIGNPDEPKSLKFSYSFNPDEFIPKFNDDKDFKYEGVNEPTPKENKLAEAMGLNEEDIEEETSEQKTLNSMGLNSKDIQENETNEEKQAEKLFGGNK